MDTEKLLDSGRTIVDNVTAVSKSLLWLRDTDSALPLAPKLIGNLRNALQAVTRFPNAKVALCDKMTSIYQRALDVPWVGIGAQERSTRLGQRTTKFGLMYALEYAQRKQAKFNKRAQWIKEQTPIDHLDWHVLFAFADKLIDCLDWGAFVIENPRGQVSNLVLEAIELFEAIQLDAEKIPEETGDVFYNLLASCLSLRIRASDVFPETAQNQDAPDYWQILEEPQKIAEFINGRIDSKLAWYQKNRAKYRDREWPTWQKKVLEILYRDNLCIKIPEHGNVVCEQGNLLIIEWRSPCPVLNRCKELGCATGDVCSTLYHVQYQALLSLIVPGAFFARDYSQLRPEGDSCIEVIVYRPDLRELFLESIMEIHIKFVL